MSRRPFGSSAFFLGWRFLNPNPNLNPNPQRLRLGAVAKKVKCLDLTLPTPAANLACDEALLDACEEQGGGEVLRFWEPRDYFVVVGVSNHVAREVNRPACQRENLGVYRRCSGGGAVLQGPGCLNY